MVGSLDPQGGLLWSAGVLRRPRLRRCLAPKALRAELRSFRRRRHGQLRRWIDTGLGPADQVKTRLRRSARHRRPAEGRASPPGRLGNVPASPSPSGGGTLNGDQFKIRGLTPRTTSTSTVCATSYARDSFNYEKSRPEGTVRVSCSSRGTTGGRSTPSPTPPAGQLRQRRRLRRQRRHYRALSRHQHRSEKPLPPCDPDAQRPGPTATSPSIPSAGRAITLATGSGPTPRPGQLPAPAFQRRPDYGIIMSNARRHHRQAGDGVRRGCRR